MKLGSIGERMLISLVDVAPARVGLPDLDELAPHRPPFAVDDPAGHHQSFADGFTVCWTVRSASSECTSRALKQGVQKLDPFRVSVVEVLSRMTQQAAAVGRIVQPRLRLLDP